MMTVFCIVLLCLIVVAARPWKKEDEIWFELSALLEAALSGALLTVL